MKTIAISNERAFRVVDVLVTIRDALRSAEHRRGVVVALEMDMQTSVEQGEQVVCPADRWRTSRGDGPERLC
jgi:hypothetical protein